LGKWSSLARRLSGDEQKKKILSEWPIAEPANYLLFVNTLQDDEEEKIRTSVNKGKPFGNDFWIENFGKKFGLEITFRSPGRPQKGT